MPTWQKAKRAGRTLAAVDAVALAIANVAREDAGWPPVARLDGLEDPGAYRRQASAALATMALLSK